MRSRLAASLLALGLALTAPALADPALSSLRLPLAFEPGPDRSAFVGRGPGYSLLVNPTGAQLTLRTLPARRALTPSAASPEATTGTPENTGGRGRTGVAAGFDADAAPPITLGFRLLDAHPGAEFQEEDPLPTRINYFLGNDPQAWRIGVPTFARVRSKGVYPGVDLVYYGRDGQMEYDFVLAPGTRPDCIRFALDGADRVELAPSGDLVMHAGDRQVRLRRPEIYQEIAGRRQPVEGRFRSLSADSREMGFEVGAYDSARPLVIDPVLLYWTFYGGTGPDQGWDVKVTPQGEVVFVGGTFSTDLYVTNALFPHYEGTRYDGYVAKVSASGTNLVFATYFGGTLDDIIYGVALDPAGNIYLTGATYSTNFPVTPNALARTIHGVPFFGYYQYDAFVSKLDPQGTNLLYSTYYGGYATDNGIAIAADPAGNAYFTGFTSSPDLPVVPASGVGSVPGGGTDDAFVVKLSTTWTPLVVFSGQNETPGANYYESSYGFATAPSSMILGGPNADKLRIATDGTTQTGLFSWTDARSGHWKLVIGTPDWEAANALPYTYLEFAVSGPATIPSNALPRVGLESGPADVSTDALVPLGKYLTNGVDGTASTWQFVRIPLTDFNPLPAGFSLAAFKGVWFAQNADTGPQRTLWVDSIRLATGTEIFYSHYLGGAGSDRGQGIAINTNLEAVVVGWAGSSIGFPVTTNTPSGTNFGGSFDMFITKVAGDGESFLFSRFLGGLFDDRAYRVALDASGDIYLTGITRSTNFPVLHPYSATNSGLADIAISKLAGLDGQLLYSTYFGGEFNDEGWGIDVDTQKQAHVTGITASGFLFPVVNAFQPVSGGLKDAFVLKLDAAGSQPIYSSFLGGFAEDGGYGIAVGVNDSAYVTGYTYSTNQMELPGTDWGVTRPEAFDNAFLARILPYDPVLTGQVTSDNALLLTWAADLIGFHVVSSGALAQTNTVWTNVTTQPMIVAPSAFGGTNQLLLTNPPPIQFYRLDPPL